MSDLADRKFIIQSEETQFEAAVSESVMQRMGSMNNFLANREMTAHNFNLNGFINVTPTPFFFGDGYITYPFPFEIVDFLLYSGDQVPTLGTVEVDAKWIPEGPGAYASLLTTTPKFDETAEANRHIRIGATRTGFVAPVLSKTQFDAYDTIRIDVLQSGDDDTNGAFVKIFVRPRDPT